MKKELAPKYNHVEVEQDLNNTWVSKGYFNAGDMSKDPFCIVIPPPNVTGKLHLGHAWDTTLQDIIARYKRLKGYDMLWLAGMDHAGIATQAKVDARLKEGGISRHDIGREKFLDHAWNWKEEYASHIREQWGTLGLSLDYSRERFTLDEGLNQAVNKIFVDLFNDGLIYRGERIINWDPKAKTALSNIEVIHKEVEGAMYTFAYKVSDSDEVLQVSTTRPETMFGDVCVVVHPEDERYQHLIGKTCVNPANGEVLPIIADDYIEIGFGTGAMKCTPAHDPNDFIIGERHHLPRVVCMNSDGTMNELAGEFNGLDRFVARKALVEKLEKAGLVIKIEKHMHQVGHSERTDVVVEPYLSKQWFVKMGPLADEVLAQQANAEEKINFYPQRFEKTFSNWLENIEDWCISRQLWWGHRIPAWYHNETGEVYVGLDKPADLENWTQDDDVLDTWFSSALWPFSTLGWPNDTADLERYFPNDVLVTGYDIIFFWVARMAFQSRYAMKSRPFKDVLIHGLVRDSSGRKMSKSLGNGVDPIEEIDKYGADALRFFLTTNSTPGQDLRYIEEKVESSWNFINKVWNASRFVMMNLDDKQQIDLSSLSMIDKWILGKLNTVLTNVEANMDKYEFALVGNELYSFIWDDFCSWYIELAKANLSSDDAVVVNGTKSTLLYVLKAITKMLHPFMPFVTERIYLSLPNALESINLETWPEAVNFSDNGEVKDVENVISMIQAVREIKTTYQLKPSYEIDVIVKDKAQNLLVAEELVAAILKRMAHATWVSNDTDEEVVERTILNGSLSVVLSSIIDKEVEIEKCKVEITKLEAEIKRATQMLSNPNFVNKAPAAKVDAEKAKLTNYENQLALAHKRLAGFLAD